MSTTTRRAAAVATAVALLAFGGAGVALAQDDAAPPSVVQLCAATDIQTVDSLLAGVANSDLVGELSPLASLVVPTSTDGIVLRGGLELDDVRTALDCGPTTTPTATPTPTTTAPPGPTYPDCAAAVAAGVAPIVRANGENGYRPELDRDGDGIACEANEGDASSTPSTTTGGSSSGGFSQLDDVPSEAAETGGGPA